VLAVDRRSAVLDGFQAQDTCPDVWAWLQAAFVPYKTPDGRDFYRLRGSEPRSIRTHFLPDDSPEQ